MTTNIRIGAEVWLFLPPGAGTPDVERCSALVRSICSERQWLIQVRRTVSLGGRAIVQGADAEALYRRCHRVRVVVISVQHRRAHGPQVLRRPPHQASTHVHWRDAISLRQFCRHKAMFHRLRLDREQISWASRFASWATLVECDGQRDPRCLPLHVFETHRGWSKRLLRHSGRAEFESAHRLGTSLRDQNGFEWCTGPAHGLDIDIVAGHSLPAGFHWDVETRGRELELWTPTAGWVVREYVNVAPNAHVRWRPQHARRIRLG